MPQPDFLSSPAAGTRTEPSATGKTLARRQFATAADDTTAPDILAKYTAEDHRKRLQNIATCNREIRQAMRIHLVTDYLFAQATYNLGEYPSLTPWNPDESDERELDRLKAMGIQLIQVFDEWSDALGLFGGDRHAPDRKSVV